MEKFGNTFVILSSCNFSTDYYRQHIQKLVIIINTINECKLDPIKINTFYYMHYILYKSAYPIQQQFSNPYWNHAYPSGCAV